MPTKAKKHVTYRFRSGKYAYRGFNIRRTGSIWKIVDADGDETGCLTLAKGKQAVDKWYKKGEVE
jgi:hypothetical protein